MIQVLFHHWGKILLFTHNGPKLFQRTPCYVTLSPCICVKMWKADSILCTNWYKMQVIRADSLKHNNMSFIFMCILTRKESACKRSCFLECVVVFVSVRLIASRPNAPFSSASSSWQPEVSGRRGNYSGWVSCYCYLHRKFYAHIIFSQINLQQMHHIFIPVHWLLFFLTFSFQSKK